MEHLFAFRPGPALLTLTLVCALPARAQVGVGTASPNPKAALDIQAADKGLLIPRLDSSQRTAISAPPDGLMVFQTDGRRGFWYAFGGAWLYLPDKTKSGDNLGSHRATRNLDLGPHQLVGNGGSNGLRVGSTGNVEIGSWASPAQLTVAGSVVAVGENQGVIVDEGNNRRVGLLKYPGREAGLWRTGGQKIEIGRVNVGSLPGMPTVFTPDLTVGSNGFVGLNTNAPFARLAIVNEGAGGGEDDIILRSYGTNTGPGFTIQRGRGTLAAPANLQNGDLIGTVGFAPRFNGGQPFFSAGLISRYRGTGQNDRSELVLATSSQERVWVNADGRVGVGTAAPDYLLDVAGDAQVRGNLHVGYQVVERVVVVPPNTLGQYDTACPGGTRVLGGGGGYPLLGGSQADVLINYTGPDPGNPSVRWRVNLHNTSNFLPQVVRLYCLCARVR